MRVQRHTLALAMTLICQALAPAAQGEVVVRMETSLGDIDIELYDEAAPVTVENFLNYVRGGDYNGSFIHRSEPGFVIQGGGYYNFNGFYLHIPTDPPIDNEFDPSRSNVRGTITMAKLPATDNLGRPIPGGGPDSATSEWFFNLADNSANLDAQNGGFTVFGQVIGDGMDVVDAIANLDIWNMSFLSPIYGGNFTNMPLNGFTLGGTFDADQHLVFVNRVREIVNVQGNQALLLDTNNNAVGLTAVEPATLANVRAVANPSSGNTPSGVAFREGFFSFEINDVTPGGSVMVAMELPAGYLPNTYYMYGPTPDNAIPHWYEFKYDGLTGAEFFDNNFIVLHFVDGGRGDSDLIANGTISDPGGPGIATATPSSSSGGGGGCTLNTTTRPGDRTDLWALLLGLIGYTGVRRRLSSRMAHIDR